MNMKKFLAVLIFGLAVFAVSCSDDSSTTDPTTDTSANNSTGSTGSSSAETQFLSSVANKKTYFANVYMNMSFSSDGRTLTDANQSYGGTYTFSSAESATKATYTGSGTASGFTVTFTLGTLNSSTTIYCYWTDSKGGYDEVTYILN